MRRALLAACALASLLPLDLAAPVWHAAGSGSEISSNWAGYEAVGSPFTSVSGSWTVPHASSSSSAGVDATWVGIGGANSHDLIQAGTQETVSRLGQATYEAWVEMLPQSSRRVPLAVHAGDSITASVTQTSSGQWQLNLKDNTTGQAYQTAAPYQSFLSSAEWIEEAPSGPGGELPLDGFGTVQFSAASAVKSGQPVTISKAGGQPITMASHGQTLASPSALGPDGASFSVTRTSSNGSTPSPRPEPGRPPLRRRPRIQPRPWLVHF
jgi:hypothetical protein